MCRLLIASHLVADSALPTDKDGELRLLRQVRSLVIVRNPYTWRGQRSSGFRILERRYQEISYAVDATGKASSRYSSCLMA